MIVVVAMLVVHRQFRCAFVRPYRLHVHRRLRRGLGDLRAELEAIDADRPARISCSRHQWPFPADDRQWPALLAALVALLVRRGRYPALRYCGFDRNLRIPRHHQQRLFQLGKRSPQATSSIIGIPTLGGPWPTVIFVLLTMLGALPVSEFPVWPDAARFARRRGRRDGLRSRSHPRSSDRFCGQRILRRRWRRPVRAFPRRAHGRCLLSEPDVHHAVDAGGGRRRQRERRRRSESSR